MLEIGKKAPLFTLPDQNGKEIALQDYIGKKIALFFYPKDMTPGCTAQACNIRDHKQELEDSGIVVLGISGDGVASHKKFETKQQLNFPLLADDTLQVIKAYGVWGEKTFMGKTYEGIHRTTFLIDESGNIAHIITKVKTKEHSQQILAYWQEH